jgi:hypothetical protein
MMVHNYFNEELSDVVFEVEALDEWRSITEELGLKGQEKVSKGKESPIPYPFMNTKLMRIAECLCPTRVMVKEYDKTPIPLDVLKAIKHCINDKHFSAIQIWYDDRSPDPFVVGSIGTYTMSARIKKGNGDWINVARDGGLGTGSWADRTFSNQDEINLAKQLVLIEYPDAEFSDPYYSPKDFYLIARWGDVIKEMSELFKDAVERTVDEIGSKLKADIATMQEKLNTLKTNAPLYISGDISKYDLTKQY